jgi:lysozyme family protein
MTRVLSDYELQVFKCWTGALLSKDVEQLRQANLVADTIIKNKDRYAQAGKPYNIPFWFVGCLHFRESSLNFTKHLHNGDPLTARTTHVPAGRPASGNPPFTWEFSASDALAGRGFGNLSWDNIHALVRFEAWNGLGYKKLGKLSPYIWSYTNQYAAGKFVADGKYDPKFVDQQPGCAAIMLALKAKGVDLCEVQPQVQVSGAEVAAKLTAQKPAVQPVAQAAPAEPVKPTAAT